MLIFDKSEQSRVAKGILLKDPVVNSSIPNKFLRESAPMLPEVSELDVVRHYTCLSKLNYSIDTNFYPLGSCTMKYNPKAAHVLAMQPGFLQRHPYAPELASQGVLQCMYELERDLAEITGMHTVSLSPMAGAQGEYAGVAMIRAYHQAKGDDGRTEMIVPDAAHGTNPATATMCGYKVKEVPTDDSGDVDLEALAAIIGPQTAGIMLTNPSTLGVFERQIEKIANMIHEVGGLLYYDGANLNAILGHARPGDMGFDVLHLNLHKTFATPHGGGGPGAGPVAANERLAPYLPTPILGKENDHYRWLTKDDRPESIGQLSTFMGNVGVLLRAHIYIKQLGKQGLEEVSKLATLNAAYLRRRLEAAGFELAFPNRRASHEFVVTMKREAKEYGVTANHVAKRLLDYGFHAPTVYFPLLVPECLLIEPTETESKQTMDQFVEAMTKILEEAKTNPQLVQTAPHTMPVGRLDDVKAAREPDLVA